MQKPDLTIDPRRIETMDDQMVAVYRAKTSAERIAIAHDMWRYARERIEASVRWLHPDWDDAAVKHEVSRRLLNGSGGAAHPSA